MTVVRRSPADRRAKPAQQAGLVFSMMPLLLLNACAEQPPTALDIRQAYAAHMERDPVHGVGLRAKAAPVAMPQQEPDCRSDGDAHFDCRIRVIYETRAGRRSEEQVIHIRRANGSWLIDSIN